MKGFLGTHASFAADLNLIVQVLLGAGLLAGALLARAKRYSTHGAVMTAVLLLNLVPIALMMGPSFHESVLPRLLTRMGKPYVAVAAFHGISGTAGELMGLYIVLVARTTLIPERLRFKKWKVWMRWEAAAWAVAVTSGIATYLTWYGAPGSR